MKTFEEIKKSTDKEEQLKFWSANCDDEVFKPYIEKAINGNAFAQYQMGFYFQLQKAKYEADDKRKEEYRLKSAYWLNKAEEQGEPNALRVLTSLGYRPGY